MAGEDHGVGTGAGGLRVLLRADADPAIGGGHVMRCLTLAQDLRHRGAHASFLSRPGTSDLVPALGRAGLDVFDPDGPVPACDVLVVDHYGLSAADERRLASATGARRVIVIDDLADRTHDCDLVVDAGLGREAAAYDGLVAGGACVLAGSAFAMLRPEFARARAGALARRGFGPVRRLLASLGLTDVGGVTLPAVEAVLRSAPPDLEQVDVVIGPAAPSLAPLRRLAADDPRIRLRIDPPDIAALMAAADLAVGAGGTSSWERCCLGLPSLVVVLADNQAAVARALADAGAAWPVDARPLGEEIGEGLGALGQSPDELAAMSAAAAAICDGLGAGRVADAVLGAAEQGEPVVGLRRAAPDDAERLWRWRNDPLTRAQSRGSAAVPWPDHVRWFEGRLADRDTWLLVATYEGEAVGTVRVDAPDGRGDREISLTLAPESRGRGLGPRVLAGACRRLRAEGVRDPLVGTIKAGNTASRRSFERAGFQVRASEPGWVRATLASGAWPSAGPFRLRAMQRAAS